MHCRVLCDVLTYPRVACLGGILGRVWLVKSIGSSKSEFGALEVRYRATCAVMLVTTLVQGQQKTHRGDRYCNSRQEPARFTSRSDLVVRLRRTLPSVTVYYCMSGSCVWQRRVSRKAAVVVDRVQEDDAVKQLTLDF